MFYRSSQQKCYVKKGALINFTKFTGKHLCQSLYFNKVAGLRTTTLLKKKLWRRYFHVDFVKFLRTPYSQNTSGRLLLVLLVACFLCFPLSEMFASKKALLKLKLCFKPVRTLPWRTKKALSCSTFFMTTWIMFTVGRLFLLVTMIK